MTDTVVANNPGSAKGDGSQWFVSGQRGRFSVACFRSLRTVPPGIWYTFGTLRLIKYNYMAPDTSEKDEITGFMRKDFFTVKAEESIREILLAGRRTACLHIYINGHYSFRSRYGKANEIRLLQKIALLLKEAFPMRLIGRIEEDRFSVIAPEEGAKGAVERINRLLQTSYPEAGISLKAGCFIIDEMKPGFRVTDAFTHAEYACNSIALFDDICYRTF